MSKSEVISKTSYVLDSVKFDTNTLINELENECYLKNDCKDVFRSEVRTKIEGFSTWFNGVARLYLLRCDSQESEIFIYLLLNLKKAIKHALSEMKKSVSSRVQSYVCKACEEEIEVGPSQNVWSTLQNHPHLEDLYTQAFDLNYSSTSEISEDVENGELSTNDEVILEGLPNEICAPEGVVNDFKFNFVITYDARVEESLYPPKFLAVAQKCDNLSEYTIQRCGPRRGSCLLCCCSLVSKDGMHKVTLPMVSSHIFGRKHVTHAQNQKNVAALQEYHEFWRSQESAYQAHQVYFVPEINKANHFKCQLCEGFVSYALTIEHINGDDHKSRVLKIFSGPETNLKYYLLDMQVQVYDITVNNVRANEKEKPKNVKSLVKKESKPLSPLKCEFVRFVSNTETISLPPRYKNHFGFFTRYHDLICCELCKINFIDVDGALNAHVVSAQHQHLSGIPLPNFKFFCEICNLHISQEVAWGNHFFKEPNRHNKVPQSRKLNVAEWECTVCQFVIYGDELSLNRHRSARNAKAGRKVTLPFIVKKFFKSKQSIEEEAKALQVEASGVLEYLDKMKECCDEMERAVSSIYPNCRAYQFGSRISGLGNNESDLDVFMDIGDMYLGERLQDSQSQLELVKKVTKALKNHKQQFSCVVPIPSARTPIVKLHHKNTSLHCDISFKHGLGVENTKFLKFCIDLQPITQPFILLLKRWSDYCKLNEHITNYGLALMAVFFLQTGGHLLSVNTVRMHNPTQSLLIDGWETLNYTVPIQKMKEFVKPYAGSIKQLLRDFFYYFSEFDYANQVVCPLLGNTVPKLFFNDRPEENLPIEMKSYVQRIHSENGEQFRGLTPFCVQDPFDLSHNLTKACHHGTINKLKTLCALTYEFLDTFK